MRPRLPRCHRWVFFDSQIHRRAATLAVGPSTLAVGSGLMGVMDATQASASAVTTTPDARGADLVRGKARSTLTNSKGGKARNKRAGLVAEYTAPADTDAAHDRPTFRPCGLRQPR